MTKGKKVVRMRVGKKPVGRPSRTEAIKVNQIKIAKVCRMKNPDVTFEYVTKALTGFKNTQQIFKSTGERLSCINEVLNAIDNRDRFTFAFQWDDLIIFKSRDEAKEDLATHNVNVVVRPANGQLYFFIYGQSQYFSPAVARLSQSLLRKQGGLVKVTPTQELFKWIKKHEMTHATKTEWDITKLPGTHRATVSGNLDPLTNVYWRMLSQDGEVRSMAYEHSRRERLCSASKSGIYSMQGDGMTSIEFEDYLLKILFPHLEETE